MSALKLKIRSVGLSLGLVAGVGIFQFLSEFGVGLLLDE